MSEHDAVPVVIPAQLCRGLKESQGGIVLVRVDFRVTLIGSDDKIVTLGVVQQLFQDFQAGNGARGVVGRTQVEQFTTLPHVFPDTGEIRLKSIFFSHIYVTGGGPG